MKLLLTEGCICDSLVIDDKDAIDYSNNELRNIIKKILEIEESKFNLIKLLGEVIKIFDCDYTDEITVKTYKYGLISTIEQNCTDIIVVEGKDINDFTEDEIRDIIINIISDNNDIANLIWVLRGFVQNLGKYKFCYHCDECGDNVVEYKLEI